MIFSFINYKFSILLQTCVVCLALSIVNKCSSKEVDLDSISSTAKKILQNSAWKFKTRLAQGRILIEANQPTDPQLSITINAEVAGEITKAFSHEKHRPSRLIGNQIEVITLEKVTVCMYQIKGKTGVNCRIDVGSPNTIPAFYLQVLIPIADGGNKDLRKRMPELEKTVVRLMKAFGAEVNTIFFYDKGMIQLTRGGMGIVYYPAEM